MEKEKTLLLDLCRVSISFKIIGAFGIQDAINIFNLQTLEPNLCTLYGIDVLNLIWLSYMDRMKFCFIHNRSFPLKLENF